MKTKHERWTELHQTLFEIVDLGLRRMRNHHILSEANYNNIQDIIQSEISKYDTQ